MDGAKGQYRPNQLLAAPSGGAHARGVVKTRRARDRGALNRTGRCDLGRASVPTGIRIAPDLFDDHRGVDSGHRLARSLASP
jgi:hypothetical protein